MRVESVNGSFATVVERPRRCRSSPCRPSRPRSRRRTSGRSRWTRAGSARRPPSPAPPTATGSSASTRRPPRRPAVRRESGTRPGTSSRHRSSAASAASTGPACRRRPLHGPALGLRERHVPQPAALSSVVSGFLAARRRRATRKISGGAVSVDFENTTKPLPGRARAIAPAFGDALRRAAGGRDDVTGARGPDRRP